MPRLPTAEELGLGGSLDVRHGTATADVGPLSRGALALAKGVQDAGGGLFDLAEKRSREDDKLGQARADAAFARDHTALLGKQADDPNREAYEQNAQEIVQAGKRFFGDPEKAELWALGKAGSLAAGRQQVNRLAHAAEGDAFLTETGQSADDTQGVLRNSQDPATQKSAMDAVAAKYDAAAQRGYITEQQAQAYKKAFAARSMHTVLGQQPLDEQVAALEGPAQGREGTVKRIVGVESGGNATARNPNSTATGLGQFTEGTWLATVQAHRPDLMQGRSREQVLALRNDGTLSKEMTGHLLDDNLAALGAKGLPANPTTGYLAHFLGVGGAAAVLKAAPGTPVSDVLGAEQIDKNRSVLAGKTVDSVIAWAGRKMGQSPLAPGLDSLPADTRQTWLDHARSQFATQQREQQRAYHEESAALQARMSDDLASIEATGQPNPLVKAEDVERVLGPQAVRDWQAQRGRSRLVHEALDGIGSLPEGEIERRMQGLEPKPGADGFGEDMAAYGKARKRADTLMQARRADPALAVESLPSVRDARTAARYDQTETGRQIQPQSAQAIVRARLAAQNQLGIPEPMAVTKSEAAVIARQLRAIGDDDVAGLRRFVGSLQHTYGEYADEVLASTIQHQNVNRDLAVAATDVLGKLSRGALPTEQDRRRLDRAGTGQRMDDALAGRVPAQTEQSAQGSAPGAPASASSSSPGSVPRPRIDISEAGQDFQNAGGTDQRAPGAEPGQFQGAPTGRQIGELFERQNDPAFRAEFNATFGPGTAERAIAELSRRMPDRGRRP